MSEIKKDELLPVQVIEGLKGELVKIESELVDESKEKKEPKFMTLSTSKHYLEEFINMTPKEINEFIDRQSDLLMMFSKDAALKLLAKATETGDNDAIEMYLKVIQASAVVAQEKIAVKKSLGFGDDEELRKPKQYISEELSQDEWEKTYTPGNTIVPNKSEPPKEPLYIVKGNKEVN